MRVEVYSEALKRRFRADRCSFAYLWWWIAFSVFIIVPFVISFAMNGFWLKRTFVFERPAIAFNRDVVLEYSGVSADGTYFEKSWSTNQYFNEINPKEVSANLGILEEDVDSDRKTDLIELDIALPIDATDRVTSVSVAVLLNVTFSHELKVEMDGYAFASYSSMAGGIGLEVDGDVQIHQRKPIPYSGSVQRLHSPLRDPVTGRLPANSLRGLLSHYRQRNATVDLHAPFPRWQAMIGASSTATGDAGTMIDFVLQLRIHAREVPLLIRPSPAQELKWAWIQYLSYSIPTFIVLFYITEFLMKTRILTAYQTVDAGAGKLHLR